MRDFAAAGAAGTGRAGTASASHPPKCFCTRGRRSAMEQGPATTSVAFPGRYHFPWNATRSSRERRATASAVPVPEEGTA
jgi:hypothetical protein